MKIDTTREGGTALLQLEGRLDREWAEHLSGTLEDLLQDGVRSLNIDFSRVTYVSSEATRVLTRWEQELALLRGDMQVTSLPPTVREAFDVAGWNPAAASGPVTLRQSSWQMRSDIAKCGDFEFSTHDSAGGLACHLHGDPDRLTRAAYGPSDCGVVPLSTRALPYIPNALRPPLRKLNSAARSAAAQGRRALGSLNGRRIAS